MRVIQLIACFTVSLIIGVYAGIRDGDLTISQFSKQAGQYPHMSNDIIRNETGGTLLEIDTLPSIRPGQLIMRKKNSNEYSLYFGTLDTSAFSKRPVLFAFPIPGWASLREILQYRFYHEPTDKPGNDVETVYFDNERIYLRGYPALYYYRNGIWFYLEGKDSLLTGNVVLKSEPPGAQVILNGENTHLITPCKLQRLLPGIHKLELFLDSYHFFQKSIKVFPDSTVTASFQLISDMDTVYITGDVSHGLLLLPQPPVDTLFKVDNTYIGEHRVQLLPGTHRISWNGGIFYESIDTLVTISTGVVSYFDVIFKRRFGILRIVPLPADAEVCIDNEPCRFGEQIMEIPVGVYRVTAHRHGFKSVKKELLVFPDTIINCEMNLLQFPDGDVDGFVDSVDRCPTVYGLHDGCPKQLFVDAVSIKKEEVASFVKNDPVSFTISTMGFLVRLPTKKRFANFLSTFSSGKIGGVNNYRGLTFLNSYQLSFKSLIAMAELGQWSSGIRYQRDDTLTLQSRSGMAYQIFFDSTASIEPTLIIPSTSLAIGIHYNLSWINVAYTFGYQWEDIIINDLFNTSTRQFDKVTFDNDWWYHQLCVESNFRVDEFIAPIAYFKFKIPFGKTIRTRWHVMQAGLAIQVTPHFRKRMK